VTHPQKILGLFHLKWLVLVQIQLYLNRNARQFTAMTTTVTCIHVLLAAKGGSIEPVEPPSLRACHVVSRTRNFTALGPNFRGARCREFHWELIVIIQCLVDVHFPLVNKLNVYVFNQSISLFWAARPIKTNATFSW